MNSYKSLKDPIYGYIQIDKELLTNVIDTANFQRLRNVIQTSYSPLYSSAVHNRFVHSLGVHHLGKIVSKAILDNGNREDTMYMAQSMIRPGYYSGNSGPKFFQEKKKSSYETLQVDKSDYCIHASSTVAETREKIRRSMQEKEQKNLL